MAIERHHGPNSGHNFNIQIFREPSPTPAPLITTLETASLALPGLPWKSRRYALFDSYRRVCFHSVPPVSRASLPGQVVGRRSRTILPPASLRWMTTRYGHGPGPHTPPCSSRIRHIDSTHSRLQLLDLPGLATTTPTLPTVDPRPPDPAAHTPSDSLTTGHHLSRNLRRSTSNRTPENLGSNGILIPSGTQKPPAQTAVGPYLVRWSGVLTRL